MRTRLIRLRFRRRLRKGQHQVEDLSSHAEQQIEQHLFKRFDRLLPIRRFVFSWVGLLLIIISGLIVQNLALSQYYQQIKNVPGGIYNEGVLGRFTTANPIYATSEADQTVSHLIFAGLFTYDDKGQLVGDLAKDYAVDENGITYTVHLKPNLTWQDGQTLDSSDVVFTYKSIQNPDAHSPLQSGWQGIEVSAPDKDTVVFKLPGPLAAFAYGMTNGIIPKHILEGVSVTDLRSADFNTVSPVGAGPFAWQAIEVEGDGNPINSTVQIGLVPFNAYAGGAPKLQKFIVQVFAKQDKLVEAFTGGQLTSVAGLESVPKSVKNDKAVIKHNLALRAANMVFFKTNAGVLSDQKVRQALVQGADVPAIISKLDYPTRAVREPILLGQVGYDASLAQPGYNQKAAKDLLDSAGWKVGKSGVRTKDGKPLTFSLTLSDTDENKLVIQNLVQNWQAIGFKVDVVHLDATDFQNALSSHNYDAVLDGITIGADPDVFVYWDSSQADIRSTNRLNLAEYKNPAADTALEAGRTRLDPTLRYIKYKPFLQAWHDDAPALGLYQPRLLYLTHGSVDGLKEHPINTSIDRFANVQNWQVREARVTN